MIWLTIWVYYAVWANMYSIRDSSQFRRNNKHQSLYRTVKWLTLFMGKQSSRSRHINKRECVCDMIRTQTTQWVICVKVNCINGWVWCDFRLLRIIFVLARIAYILAHTCIWTSTWTPQSRPNTHWPLIPTHTISTNVKYLEYTKAK